jgi:hypothetical protein
MTDFQIRAFPIARCDRAIEHLMQQFIPLSLRAARLAPGMRATVAARA